MTAESNSIVEEASKEQQESLVNEPIWGPPSTTSFNADSSTGSTTTTNNQPRSN
jgi:hypothetical protein